MFHVIDVSHHQNPTTLDWSGMRAAGCDGMIARLTYGTMIDKRAAEHIARARDAGMSVGAYHFGRPSQPVGEQIEAFAMAARLAGYGKPEDMIPVLDVEDDTEKRPIDPSHSDLFESMATLLTLAFGQKPYCYITQRDWGRLGRPERVLKLPLHVAHYAAPSRIEPATPNGRAWDIWQHRVADFAIPGPSGYDKNARLPLDQNRARKIRFLNGDFYEATLAMDEQFPTERHIEDTDRTHEKRARVLEQILRAEAQYHATESKFSLLDRSRLDGIREAAGIETQPPNEPHDTEPPSDTADTDRPPPESV
jgi:hypothetical protein